jgi:hypothetical protein
MKLAKSLFVSDEIHEKEVKLPNGEVHKLHFKELSAVEFRKFQMAEFSEDDEVKATSMAKLISSSLVDPDGKQALTLPQALKLNSAATNAMIAVILGVNGFGEQKKD